jgi:hypothetical protein
LTVVSTKQLSIFSQLSVYSSFSITDSYNQIFKNPQLN